MATKKKKKVTLCWDNETLNIVGTVPSSYRSTVIRNVIKRAKSEGLFDDIVRDALGIAITTPVREPEQDAATPITLAPPPVPSIRPPMQQEEAKHSGREETLAELEEAPVGVDSPPPDKMDEPDELDENDPAN